MLRVKGSNKAWLSVLLIGLSFVFSGCCRYYRQAGEKNKGMTCRVSRVSRESLIKPTVHKASVQKEDVVQKNTKKWFSSSITLSKSEQHEQYEAQLSDVAFPLMATPSNASCGSNGALQLSYICSLSLSELTQFYVKEMERLGWQQTVHFEGEEILFVFHKVGKFCVVTMRPAKKGWGRSKKIYLSLFLGKK